MKQSGQIIEPNGTAKKCECGSDMFTVSRGMKKQNKTATTWEQKAYYIETCTNCGHKDYQTIYDWRKVSTTKGGDIA